MGSSFLNTPYKPWTPADSVLRDCSQGICSFYCPQWCSVVYPPPPPPPLPSLTAIGVAATATAGDDDSSSFRLSPLIVALIGILGSVFVLITYYTIISRFCTRRTRIHQNDTNQGVNDNNESATQGSSSSANTTGGGLDDTVIRSITVCKYKKGDGLVEGTDCSVCLSEFQDCESLRLLPKCKHAFHLPCIDTWLRSHSSCPLCRSNIVESNTCSSSSSGNLPNQRENSQLQEPSRTQSVNVSALEYQYRNETVIVIQGSEQEIQVGFAGNLEERNGSESNRQGRLLLVADILRSSEDDEDEDEEIDIGSSKENRDLIHFPEKFVYTD